MKRRYVGMLLALGVAMSLFVGAIATGGAATNTDGSLAAGDRSTGAYFPWVAYGHELGDQGPFYGTVTVQNTNDWAVDMYFFPGDPEGWGEPYKVNDVQPWASTTATAAQIGLEAPGGAVRVHAVASWVNIGFDDDDQVFVAPDDWYWDDDGDEGNVWDDGEDLYWLDEGQIPFMQIAGSVKNVSPQPTVGTSNTNANHITVDGYSGMTMQQIARNSDNSGEYVLPIVQTNDGWDTELKISNFAADGNVNYNVEFIESGGSLAGTGNTSMSGNIYAGETKILDIMDASGIGEGWIGSVYVSANAPLGVVAERYKNVDDMLVTNVSRPTIPLFENGENNNNFWNSVLNNTVAPLVFQDYNFWNTGISVANLDENNWNDVQIDFYAPSGALVGGDSFRIDPAGQKFLFVAGNQNLGLGGQIGAAIVRGSTSLHAAVDQVKYLGDDEEVGQAMSYVTVNGAEKANFFGNGNMLSVPLVQKGNTATGNGDTSGIQYFNSNGTYDVFFEVEFYSTTGNLVSPTINNPLQFRLSSHQGATVYTHNYSSLSNGFTGSVVTEVTSGQGWLSAVSNNVNYEVQGDGSVAYQAVLINGEYRNNFIGQMSVD